MSKSNVFENETVLKTFQDVDFTWDANTTLYVSLHDADPTEAGNQTTNECSYGSYDRVAVARDATGWDVVASVASNDDQLLFPQSTLLDADATYVGIGTVAYPGAGILLYSGALNSPIPTNAGIQPLFSANQLTVTED